jgi:hypothetical protein
MTRRLRLPRARVCLSGLLGCERIVRARGCTARRGLTRLHELFCDGGLQSARGAMRQTTPAF